MVSEAIGAQLTYTWSIGEFSWCTLSHRQRWVVHNMLALDTEAEPRSANQCGYCNKASLQIKQGDIKTTYEAPGQYERTYVSFFFCECPCGFAQLWQHYKAYDLKSSLFAKHTFYQGSPEPTSTVQQFAAITGNLHQTCTAQTPMQRCTMTSANGAPASQSGTVRRHARMSIGMPVTGSFALHFLVKTL